MTALIAFALNAFAFFVRHWKLVLAFAAIGGMGIEGFHLARSWDEKAALTAQAETLKKRLATITFLQATDAKRAQDNADTIEKLQDAARETPTNPTACLPRDAVGRLRSIR
jgi:hypothetical protein